MHLPGLQRRRTRRIAVWISLALVVMAGIASLLLIGGISSQLNDISETYAVRDKARELVIAMTQAEANQRGYLLTGEGQYLAPYHEAASTVKSIVDDVLAMTSNDPAQFDRMQSITGNIASKVAEMSRTIQLVATQREADAQRLTETGMGFRLMGEVRQTLNAFIAEENDKLVNRNEAIGTTRVWLVGSMIAALAAAVCLGYALFSRTQRQVSAMTLRHRGLITENEALEAEVAERTRTIEEARAHAERERQRVEALLQDTSHRIGNSLATVSSLLGLQLMRTRSEEVKSALEAARFRVHAIASAHRRLRLGDDMDSAQADEFLNAVIQDIVLAQPERDRFAISRNIDPIEVSARDATTLGILVGELITNALKHGFPDGRKGTVEVSLARDAAGCPELVVSDDGVGLPPEQDDGGLGSIIIRQLSEQFGGAPRYESAPGGGLTVSVKLPSLDNAPNLSSAHPE